MDEYSGKRAIDGLVVSKKGSGLVLRDAANNRDRNAQFCNRIGCSGRLNSMKSTKMSCSEKAKSSRPSFRSASSGKEIVGSSSNTSSSVSNPRKSFTESRKKLSSQLETDSSESGSVQDEPEVSELNPPSRIVQGSFTESIDVESSKDTMIEVGSSSVLSNSRSRKSMNQKFGFGNRETLTGSVSLVSRSIGQATRTNVSRYGLRNLRCNSISDVIPSGCSISDSNLGRRKDGPKKRNCEGESSSPAKGKKLSGPASEGRSSNSCNGISISDSRRARNCLPSGDSVVGSVRTRRSVGGYTRARLSNQENRNSTPNESSVVSSYIPQPEFSIELHALGPSHQFSEETPFNCQNSYSRPGSSSGRLRCVMPTSPTGVGMGRSLMNRDGFRHCNMDGIAEVLLALERIEQDEDLTYEQLLVLETNLFIGGLNLYDQHREMRLDIDNMSYEELLALEERMGSVNTALTEEALSKCLETSIYLSIPENEIMGCASVADKDDIKCSICQEEYGVGDDIGRLKCEHKYHVGCIHQWLRLKNWCPICKAAAATGAGAGPSHIK